MAGVYCPRCETKVLLEQDGQSCSNCGRKLVIAAPTPPHERPAPSATPASPRRRARPKAKTTPKPAA